MGDIEITSPRDRNASFTPQIIQKPSTDVIRDLEDKVLAMYVRGISQMDIACTIEDIYGFNISSETISAITYPNDKSFLKALYLQIIELYKNEIVAR